MYREYAIFALIALMGLGAFLFRRQVKWGVEKGMRTMGVFWTFQFSLYPVILTGIGYAIPALREPATIANLFGAGGVVILVVVGVAGFIVQVFTANDPMAPLRTLITDFLYAGVWVIIGVALSVYLMVASTLPLFIAIPTLFAMLDMFVNTPVAIRNAFQRTEVAQSRAAS